MVTAPLLFLSYPVHHLNLNIIIIRIQGEIGDDFLERKNDFSKGSIIRNIMNMAIPMILAQIVNVLYSIVDRLYIARIPNESFDALTGIGICLPVISIVMAFANLFGMGGAPLCSIERGRGNLEEAEHIMGNSFIMLTYTGIILTILGLIFKKPMLYLFGASDITYKYANEYITIYLLGNIFVMISLGMNHFINSQGFSRIGMLTVTLGAVTNIILDPIFIFLFNMGIRGAAIATVTSQFLSAAWVLKFLTGENAIFRLNKKSFTLKWNRIKNILALGVSGFVMQFTNSLVQIILNTTLQQFGGDLYVGIMTVINSIREFAMMPITGLTRGAQPVMGFNYGAGKYDRVKKCIKFITIFTLTINTLMWTIIQGFPEFFIKMFNEDPAIIEAGVPMIRIFYLGFFLMSLQQSGQNTFVALGKSKFATFFSIFRKVILVVPLAILLPRVSSLGHIGVFLSEPISEFIGGVACYATMMLTVWKELRGGSYEENQQS